MRKLTDMKNLKGFMSVANDNLIFYINRVFFLRKEYKNYFLPAIFITLAFVSFLVASKMDTGSYNALIIIFGPALWLIFLGKGVKSIIPVFILACYANYFIMYFKLPEFLMWYIELCAIALLCRITYVLTSKNERLMTPFILVVLGGFAIHILSFLLNNIPIEQLAISIRRYYLYYALFLAMIILPARIGFYEALIKVLIFTAFIQIPISVIQHFLFVRADFVGGLFGKHASGVISTMGISFVFLGYYLYRYYRKNSLFLFSMVGMILTLVLAESKIAMLFLPIAYVYSVFLTEKRFRFKRLFLILLMVPLYIGGMYWYDSLHHRSYMQRSLRDPSYMLKFELRNIESMEERMHEYRGDSWTTYDRIESIPFAFALIKRNPQKFLIGYGPGKASKSLYVPGSLLEYGFYPTFVVTVLLEIGVVGLVMWFAIFTYLFVINIRCLRYFLNIKSKSLWKAFCFFANIYMLVCFIELFYSKSILLPYNGLFFWLINGITFWFYQNRVVKHQWNRNEVVKTLYE